MGEENDSKIEQMSKNKLGQVIKMVLKKRMKPLLIVLGIFLIAIIIFSVTIWHLKLLDTRENDKDPKNAPAAVRRFLNDTSIDENGNITSGKSIQEFWNELVQSGNRITAYLNSAEELGKLIYAARALDYPDTRENVDDPIQWNKLNINSTEIQGIVKFKRALADGKNISMTYVSPTEFQELISKYKSSGDEKDKEEALKHFTLEKVSSTSGGSVGVGAKVPSLDGMVFMGDSILSMVSFNSSQALEKEGAKTMFRGGSTARYFLGQSTATGNTNNCKEDSSGHFIWEENFKDVTNPTGFYLFLGQNYFNSDDRITQTDELIKKIRSYYPNPPIYINSVYRYMNKDNDAETQSVKKATLNMNEELKKYCQENANNNIYYSDTLREYDEDNKSLRDHTYDDDHPNAEGARIIIKNIKENIIGTSTNTTGTNYTASSGQTSTTGTSSYSGKATGQMIVDEAEKYVGKLPYVWGGQSLTTGADCSGFAWAILKKLGLIDWGRTNDAGFQDKGTAVSDISQAQPGDILRFKGHIAIYKGNGYMVEALNSRVGITNTRKVTDESRPVIAIRRFTDDPGSASGTGTGITASTPEEIASIPRSYNNDVFNVDENNWIDPMVKMDPPYNNGSGSREYRAIQACCYDGKYAIAAQNKNVRDNIDASSIGGRIIWLNMETGELEHEVITSEGGHMGEGIAYDTERNMVIFHTGSGDFLEIDGNTKSISGHSKASEYPGIITYLPTTKQLVGVTEGELNFFKYDSSKNEYVKQSSVKMSEWPNPAFQGVATDGQCIYVFDSSPGGSNERVWVYSLDGQLREEHSLGSGYPRGKECESGFSDNNGNLWIGTNHSLVKVINYKANPANVNPGSSSGSKMYNMTYQVKVATWSEHQDKVSSNDPEVSSYDTGMVHDMTTTAIPYQAIVSKYKMPFNYLWTMLVYSNDKNYTFDLADLVKNSKIEITIHDNLNETTNVVTDTYTDYTKIHAEADVNISFENVHTITKTDPTTKDTINEIVYTTEGTDQKHGVGDGDNTVNYKVVHTTITNTNTLDIALTLADAWCARYVKEYTYNGKKNNDSNSSSTLEDIVHAPVTKNGELGGQEGKVDQDALNQANYNDRINLHVTGRENQVATYQTTRMNRNKSIHTETTTSSYSSAGGTNIDRSTVSTISTPKTGSLNKDSYVDLIEPKSDGDANNPIQGFCLVGDNLIAYVIHHNSGNVSTLYLADINTMQEYDHVDGLEDHGNSIAYDSQTGEIIFPEVSTMKLVKVNLSTNRFESIRTLPLPEYAKDTPSVAYNQTHDLFISHKNIYTREAFYSGGKPFRQVEYSKLDSDDLPAGCTSYGNQIYYYYAEGYGHSQNYLIVCNINTGKQEEIIHDNMAAEGEEPSFSSDGTLYICHGVVAKPFQRTDYNYFSDNNIDKSNISPNGSAGNDIARYNTGGEHTENLYFEKVFNSHYNARSNILSAIGWLYEALEQNEDTANMVDITKYLIGRAKGNPENKEEFLAAIEKLEEGFTDIAEAGGKSGIDGIQGQIYDYLLAKGVPPVGAAAVMGNIQGESYYFRPDAVNELGCSGLCQWKDGRLDNLKKLASSKGKDWTDVECQLDYLWEELNGKYTKVRDVILSADQESELEYATWYWGRYFEVFFLGDSFETTKGYTAKRYEYAQHWYQEWQQHHTSGAATSSVAYANASAEEKVKGLFPNGAPQTREQAESYLTTVNVPITNKDGTKGTRGVRVHKAIAQDVYNACLAAQNSGFKIYDIGGYRTFGTDTAGKSGGLSYSQHCYGLAVDINPTENGQFKNGKATGNWFYDPGGNEYSIQANSTLVTTFKSMGWGWGGEWHSSKDYMHFSFMGT